MNSPEVRAEQYRYLMINYWARVPKMVEISKAEYEYWMNAPLPAGYSVEKANLGAALGEKI